MTQAIRLFLSVESTAFIMAALTHFGILTLGFQHQKAGIAESVIALVLLAGLALTWILPGATRAVGLAAQGFALLGNLVGIFTIAIGVGPQTRGDIAYHIVIVVVLLSGVLAAVRKHIYER